MAAFPTSWCLVVVVATLGCSVWHQPVPLSSWGSWGHPAVTSAVLSLLFHLRPHSNSWGEGVTQSSWRTRCAPPPPGDQKQSHSQDTQQRPRALKARSDLGLVRGGPPVRPLPALKTRNISSSPAALPTQDVAGYAAVSCSRTSHTWWQARQGPGALGSARCPVWWPPSSQAWTLPQSSDWPCLIPFLLQGLGLAHHTPPEATAWESSTLESIGQPGCHACV